MPRPSNREQRRREIVRAFERALARHGLGGATIAVVADEAGVAPGLLHHHFRDREDMVVELVASLIGRFRADVAGGGKTLDIESYIDAAVGLGSRVGMTAAKAWTGIFAEAIRSRTVAAVVRKVLRAEVARLQGHLAARGLSASEAETVAAGITASVIGCLVFGALMPGKASGFAAPFLKRVVVGLLSSKRR